eukprot:1702513-Rhodomonas_salina.1
MPMSDVCYKATGQHPRPASAPDAALMSSTPNSNSLRAQARGDHDRISCVGCRCDSDLSSAAKNHAT